MPAPLNKEACMTHLEVSIEQADCTSCGLCPEIAKEHFFMGEDGVAYVREANDPIPDVPLVAGYQGKVAVGAGLEERVIEAAEECPGECIYVHAN